MFSAANSDEHVFWKMGQFSVKFENNTENGRPETKSMIVTDAIVLWVLEF